MKMDPLTTNTTARRQGHRHLVITEEVEMPPRSKLYCLTPLRMGTVVVESLTSYINRLAWTYRVSSWVLVVQEILPCYHGPYSIGSSPHQLGGFGRTRAMRLNGTGEVARAWAKTLEQLTMRADLHLLTADPWASGLPNWGFLRSAPVWCPACYQQWQEQGQPLYQPLLWALQAVTVCLHHRQPLVEQCPFCQKKQSAIGAKTAPGYCTQCGAWLGKASGSAEKINEELFNWQTWVVSAVKELYLCSLVFGSIPWNKLPDGLTACVEAVGGARECGRMLGVPHVLFSTWQTRKRLPSFTYVLAVCYMLDLSPFQLMTVEAERLQTVIYTRTIYQQPPALRRPASPSKGDPTHIQEYLQRVLDGKVAPLPVRQMARDLGVGEKFLVGRFPQVCAQITTQYQAYRTEQAKQRVMQECDEVQRVMYALHEQGTPPTLAYVAARLSNPHILRRPEAKARWHAIQHKLRSVQE
jgi:hypothetical protein